MEFACSICNYTSPLKTNVLRHIKKPVHCGQGERKIIEIAVDILCEHCNRTFTLRKNLKSHIDNNVCGIRNINVTTNVVAPNIVPPNIDLAKQIEELKEEVHKLKLEKAKPSTVNNYFTVNNYYNTDLSVLKDEDFINLIEDSENYQLVPRFVKLLHFNSKFPQNHNICISNSTRNNKHVKFIEDGVWQLANKETQINNLIIEKEDNINEWVTGPGSKYPDTAEKFNDYLELKTDEDVKIIKQDIELLLYNGSKLINQ